MFKNLLLCFSFFFFTSSLNAQVQQDSLQQTVIQLIDGSLIKARILDRNDEFTRIKIISGDILLLNNDLIVNIGDNLTFLSKKKVPPRSALTEKGKYHILSIGVLAGRDSELEEGLIFGYSLLNFVKGYQINQYLGLGAGFGFDNYDNAQYFPIHMDVRGNFNIKKTTLFYSFQAGYAFGNGDFKGSNVDVKNKGGLMLYPAIGLKFPTQSKTDILLEFGYRNQWAKRTYSWEDNPDEIVYQRYAFRVGFSF